MCARVGLFGLVILGISVMATAAAAASYGPPT